jgi:hypothetical protein
MIIGVCRASQGNRMNAICNKGDSRGAEKLLVSESQKKFAAIESGGKGWFEGRQTLFLEALRSCRGLVNNRA